MNYVALKAAMDAHTEGAAWSDEQWVAYFAEPVPVRKSISAGRMRSVQIAGLIGATNTHDLLTQMEASGGALARFAKWIENDTDGPSFSDPQVEGIIDSLPEVMISSENKEKLKAYAWTTQPRMAGVRWQDVARAKGTL